MNSGKLITVGMLVVALAAATAAWWHNQQKGRRALEFWGGEAAFCIRTAEQVRLEVASSTKQPIDISKARGLVHARQALISDASFDWTATAGADDSTEVTTAWQYVIEFVSSDANCRVLLDLDQGWIARDDRTQQIAKLTIQEGLQKFLDEIEQVESP